MSTTKMTEKEHAELNTTDAAASMEVLKKCAEKLQEFNVMISKHCDGWQVTEIRGKTTNAQTLELAIALFARKIFSK